MPSRLWPLWLAAGVVMLGLLYWYDQNMSYRALAGTALFSIIVGLVQSGNPRLAGMWLTFPALNGITLLTAQSTDPQLMAASMVPMIAVNGMLCAFYIFVQTLSLRTAMLEQLTTFSWFLFFLCIGVWYVFSKISVSYIAVMFILAFLSSPWLLGSPVGSSLAYRSKAYSLKNAREIPFPKNLVSFLKHRSFNILSALVLISLTMLLVKYGATQEAGKWGAFPILPLLALVTISTSSSESQAGRAREKKLQAIRTTVMYGPLVAIGFVSAFAAYLEGLALGQPEIYYFLKGILGLSLLWLVCAFLLWLIASVMQSGPFQVVMQKIRARGVGE